MYIYRHIYINIYLYRYKSAANGVISLTKELGHIGTLITSWVKVRLHAYSCVYLYMCICLYIYERIGTYRHINHLMG
jgi:hypothetical protein